MEMRALPLEAPNPPTFGPLQSARRLQAYECNLQETGILFSALTEVGQQLNDRLRFSRNLTTVCQRAVFARASDAGGRGKMSHANELRLGSRYWRLRVTPALLLEQDATE